MPMIPKVVTYVHIMKVKWENKQVTANEKEETVTDFLDVFSVLGALLSTLRVYLHSDTTTVPPTE